MFKRIIIISIIIFSFVSNTYAKDKRFNNYLSKIKSGNYFKQLEFKKYNFSKSLNRMSHKRDVVMEAFKILHTYYQQKWSIDASFHLCGCRSPFDLSRGDYLNSTLSVLNLIEKKMHYQDSSFLFECQSALDYMVKGYEFAAPKFLNDYVASKEKNYCKKRNVCKKN